MKIYQLIVTVVTAFTLFSCAAEDNNGLDKPTAPTGEPATLKLTITDPVTRTRAAGSTGGDNAISDLSIFIFGADGYIDRRPIYTENIADLAEIGVTTAAKEIYIIANIGNSLIEEIGNKKQLLEAQIDLLNMLDGGGYEESQTPGFLCMTGKNEITWNDREGTAIVNLELQCAKIEILPNISGLTNIGKDLIKIDGVVLLYAGAKANYFTTTVPPTVPAAIQTSFYTATQSYSPSAGAGKEGVTNTENNDPIKNPLFTAAIGNVYFYTFANDTKTYPTIVALRGTREENGIPTVRYWPVELPAIEAGKSYKVTMTLTGTTAGGADGGSTTNPEMPKIKGALETTVTPGTWMIPSVDIENSWS